MPVTAAGVPKPRKPRPSRARGLRTTTGCLTCRKRRVKCDEQRPRCAICTKSDRECLYASAADFSKSPETNCSDAAITPASSAHGNAPTSSSPRLPRRSVPNDVDPPLFAQSPELAFDSPLTSIASMPSPNSAPLEWYDLLAEDAINNIDKYNLNVDIGPAHLSRRQSVRPDEGRGDPQLQGPDSEAGAGSPHAHYQPADKHRLSDTPSHEQWNTPENLPLNDDEIVLFQHYVGVVGPILDLVDPTRQFSTTVPRLAVRNLGVLKSLLAVAARHLALLNGPQQQKPPNSGPNDTDPNSLRSPLFQLATQYYYETLHYLSQNLLYPLYSKSREIIATALLISTYEMFDAEGAYSNGAWERHLRGIFWIQRAQNNNGESKDPLRRAAWWCWIRQDTWVALREGRRVLTIWRPTRRLDDLTPDELCLRIVYICGRCVDFAANEKKYDVNTRIEQGQKLTQALEDWQDILPASFQPIYKLPRQVPSGLFAPIWINPPSYAAAIQTFHCARIMVLVNQPSVGGMEEFQARQRRLDESVDTICGIVMMHQGKDISSAMVNVQALFVAGLSVQDPAKRTAIFQLLEKTLDVTKYPHKVILDDLTSRWRAVS